MTKLQEKIDLGHWSASFKLDPKLHFGFLYCIVNTVTNQHYIGKKNFYIKGKKTSKHYGKEHSWRTYTGSSSTLNEDIAKLGKDKFTFTIIEAYKTKGGLYYAEAYTQMLVNAMTTYSSEGVPMFYNRQIAAIRFIPKEHPTARTLKFISKIKKAFD